MTFNMPGSLKSTFYFFLSIEFKGCVADKFEHQIPEDLKSVQRDIICTSDILKWVSIFKGQLAGDGC